MHRLGDTEELAQFAALTMSDSKVSCPICVDSYDDPDDICSTVCGHIFHFTCMLQWKEKSNTCPMCNRNNPEPHRIFIDISALAGSISADNDNHRGTSNVHHFDDNQELFLGNVPKHASEEALKSLFSQFGSVIDLRILHTGKNPMSYGFITYSDTKAVKNCLAHCPLYFPNNTPDGHKLNVEEKKPRTRANPMSPLQNMGEGCGSNIINKYQRNMSSVAPLRSSLSNSGRGDVSMMRGNTHSSRINTESHRIFIGSSSADNNNRRGNSTIQQFGDNQQLFLGNIPNHASEEELKTLLSQFGSVIDLRIVSTSKHPNRYGFITYSDPEAVQNCLANCPLYFPNNTPDGHKLNVEEKKSRTRANNMPPRDRGRNSMDMSSVAPHYSSLLFNPCSGSGSMMRGNNGSMARGDVGAVPRSLIRNISRTSYGGSGSQIRDRNNNSGVRR